jgi:uncharacterized protein involved in high-affinity Fe2+ transport
MNPSNKRLAGEVLRREVPGGHMTRFRNYEISEVHFQQVEASEEGAFYVCL